MRSLKRKMTRAAASRLALAAASRLALCALLSALSVLVARGQDSGPKRLPTGRSLDTPGRSVTLGSLPLAMLPAPGGEKLIVSLGGWREQGIQVVDLKTLRVEQTLKQGAAFLGLAFSRDGRTLYASGGNDDAIYCYDWDGATAKPRTRIELAKKEPNKTGTRYPAGLAVSGDGKFLYVAENVGDALAVVDLNTSTVVERLPTEHYPYAVAVAPGGAVYVSAWGGRSVSVFRPQPDGKLFHSDRIGVGRHPSALTLDASGSSLFVALASTDEVVEVDTRLGKVVRRFTDAAPGAPQEGATPNAIALSRDGSRLFVAEADNNAVAVFDLARRRGPVNAERPAGRVPVDWYPTDVLERAGELLVLCGKGRGTSPNPDGPTPGRGIERPLGYVFGQLNGTLRVVPDSFNEQQLAALTRRVAAANGWDSPARARRYPPFRHVVYIIKENRTYDQVFGDLPHADGDPSLVFFGKDSTPNHRALAARFGLFDRFFTNAEVSSQGHVWSTAAYVTDYGEKTIPSLYSDRRADADEGDADEPANGFLWTLAVNSGVSFRDYGEWVQAPATGPQGFSATRPGLAPDISPTYPPFDMSIPDQRRADAWIAELREFTRRGEMPRLEIMHLPGDHTAGARPGMRTPRACMADNDLALGRIVEALSHSPFWRDTVVFVVEDDAQAGPDHFDSHRSPLLVISAYNRPGTISRFANTTDVVAAIEDILGLGRLSQFDYFSRSLSDLFSPTPDLAPYSAIKPAQPLDELNPSKGPGAQESKAFDLSAPDRVDDAAFNRVLWEAVKGDAAPAPPPRHAAPLQLLRMGGDTRRAATTKRMR
jgi:DNA-binding beta-propeller fold protein YncE